MLYNPYAHHILAGLVMNGNLKYVLWKNAIEKG